MQRRAEGVSLKETSRVLGVSVSTLQRDIAAGCPTVELGGVGRGKGSLVDVEEVRQWRARQRGDVLPCIESAIMEVFQSEVHCRIKIHAAQLAYVLLKVYESTFERVKHLPLTELPEQMQRLCAICLTSIENGQFHHKED